MHYVNIGHFHQTLLSFIHHLIPFCLKECDTLFTLKWLPQAISCSIKKYLLTFVIFFTNPYPVVSIGNHWLIHNKTIVAYFMFFLIFFFFNKNAINHSFTFETKVVYLINCFPASTPQTPLLRLYVAPPPPLLLLDFGFCNWNYHLYCVEEVWGVGRQNEDSLLLFQQVNSGPPTLKEIYSFIIISFLWVFLQNRKWLIVSIFFCIYTSLRNAELVHKEEALYLRFFTQELKKRKFAISCCDSPFLVLYFRLLVKRVSL